MCGIAGFWDFAGRMSRPRDALRAMADVLRHRGPDDEGLWFDADSGVGLAHRRLSIVDLSPEGHQPMVSASGRYHLVFNGEIYNHDALRAELRDVSPWRGHSDTEVMLAAFDAWGLRDALARFNGMFAFALWDRARRELHLVRDRLGIKPLYWGRWGGGVAFASELGALERLGTLSTAIDPAVLPFYLAYGHVPAPFCILKDAAKLPPGGALTVSSDARVARWRWWSTPEVVARAEPQAAAQATEAQPTEARVERLEALLLDAVRLRMVADVPIGAFLSGGVDSSLIVALMQRQASTPVRTFSVGFEDQHFNEAQYARAVAHHLGTDHTERIISPSVMLGLVPRLATVYSEPFADASQLPTMLVSQVARQAVTVSLSGDGGDELFRGYELYRAVAQHWCFNRRCPAPLRLFARRLRGGLMGGYLRQLQRPRGDARLMSGLMWAQRRLAYLGAEAPERVHAVCLSRNGMARHFVQAPPPHASPWDDVPRGSFQTFEGWQMALDLTQYMAEDVLMKVDRASMATSLEVRTPLLDHRLIEFAATCPLDMKVRAGDQKWLLKQVLYRHVPRALVDRPKQGFSVPLAAWLRGPLRDWADALLDATRLKREGFLHAARVRGLWRQLLHGGPGAAPALWHILMFQAWLEARR